MARDIKIRNWETPNEGKCSSSERKSTEGNCEATKRRKAATENGGRKKVASDELQVARENGNGGW
jgi:hypothetical protein